MLVVAVGTVSAAAAAPLPPHVTLTAVPALAAPGATVRLAARTTWLPHGYALVIRATRAGRVVKVAECAKTTCAARWTERAAGAVAFRALVVRGSTVAARSRAVRVRWHVAPPPEPIAAVGRYCGFTDEGKSICFDVTADQHVANLRTESIVTCPDASKWLWTVALNAPDALKQLSFSYSYMGPLGVDPVDQNVSATYTLSGTFDTAGHASGTVGLSRIMWDVRGMHYDCAGVARPWTAHLGA
jgi:hypothetical protein